MALMLTGGRVLDPNMNLRNASVIIEGDRISDVIAASEVESTEMEQLDVSGKFVIPGLVNAHTHAHANLARGLADNWALEDLLNCAMATYGGRSAEEHYTSAALGAIEMLKTGCTAAYDLFMALPAPTPESLEAVVRAYADVGLRAVIAPAMADIVFHRTVPGLLDLLPYDLKARIGEMRAGPTDELLGLAEGFVEQWHETSQGRIQAAVAPTIPGQCSDAFLSGLGAIATRHGVGVHVHLAETKPQALYTQQRWGRPITDVLDDLGLLSPRFVAAHGIWVTEHDISRLAARGAGVVHNPASNLKLGSGFAPVREMIERGIVTALGSDGSISSDNQNMFEAMRCAALSSKIRFPYQQDQWVGAREVLQMATTGGAQALGLPEQIGAIAPGYKADITVLNGDSTFLTPLHDVANALVYAETGTSVDTVIVDGKVVMQDGIVTTVDETRLLADAARFAERFDMRRTSAWPLADALRPYVTAACRQAVGQPFDVDRYASRAMP